MLSPPIGVAQDALPHDYILSQTFDSSDWSSYSDSVQLEIHSKPVFEFSLSPLRIDDDSFSDSAAADSAVALSPLSSFLLPFSERTSGVSPVILIRTFNRLEHSSLSDKRCASRVELSLLSLSLVPTQFISTTLSEQTNNRAPPSIIRPLISYRFPFFGLDNILRNCLRQANLNWIVRRVNFVGTLLMQKRRWLHICICQMSKKINAVHRMTL